jgi:hypothetical protein
MARKAGGDCPVVKERWRYVGHTIRFVDGYEFIYLTWQDDRGRRFVWLRDFYRLWALGAGKL